MVASIYGIAFGVVLHLPRIVPGLEGIRDLPRMQQEQSVSIIHFVGDIGSFIGRFALAFLAISLLTRQQVLRTFQLPGLLIFPALFAAAPFIDVTVLAAGALLAGIARYSAKHPWRSTPTPTVLRHRWRRAARQMRQ